TGPYYLSLLAEVYRTIGQVEEGLSVVAEALAAVDKAGERFYEAELYRLKGELLLTQESQKSKGKSQKSKIPNTQHPTPSTRAEGEAEEYFLKALDIARKQQAKSLELRAVMSLARLRQQQVTGRASRNTHHASRTALAETHQMLAEIYGWFTEGFDTKDL